MAKDRSDEARKAYQKALMDLVGCRPVAYWPLLARRVGGVKAAVMLSQLLYWGGDDIVKKRGGWIYKSVKEMEKETGLTELEQKTARKILSDKKIIQCALRGVPRIWQYLVDTDELGDILVNWKPPESPLDGNTVQCCPASPSNGNTVQCRTVTPSNVGRDSRGMFHGNTVQLNKVLETTVKTTDLRLPSSSSPQNNDAKKQEEEGPTAVFSTDLQSELLSIGVYDNLLTEVASSGFSEDQLYILIGQAKEKEPEPGKTGALFMYKVRNMPKEAVKPQSQREEEDRRRYIGGQYADWIQH